MKIGQERILSTLTKVINLLTFIPIGLTENLKFILTEMDRLFNLAQVKIVLLEGNDRRVFTFRNKRLVEFAPNVNPCLNDEHVQECRLFREFRSCPVLQDSLPITRLSENEPEGCKWCLAQRNSAYACLPIVGGKELLGSLSLRLKTGESMDRMDLEVLLALTNLIGLTTQRERLLSRIEKEKERLEEANRHLGELANTLILAEKLAASGHIAAELIHEINNPMGIISASAECLLMEQADRLEREAVGDLRVIVKQARRVGEISGSLLNFIRSPQIDLPEREFDVRAAAHEVVSIIKTILQKKGIELRWQETEECVRLRIKENHLQQVLLNLIWNAVDAMPNGGILTIRVLRDNREVKIQIEDTGDGVPIPLRAKIFEPFYTTKPYGQGTGLGLSICQRILQQYGGRLKVGDGELGACFEIRLPVTCGIAGEGYDAQSSDH